VKQFWRAESGIFLVLWAYLLWIGEGQFLLDPGVFWNTVIGQHILEQGDVPRAEEFSCTLRGQAWNSHQWLAQCLMALLHRIGGLDTLYLATATFLAALYTWIAHRVIRAGWHWVVGFFVALLTLLASSWHFNARPHLATIVLLGWTFARLVDYEAGRIPLRGLVWLPLAMILWTNLHGGALGGVATVALVVFGWCAFWLMGASSPIGGFRGALWLLALLLACAAATLVNPYGWHLPADWIRLMGSPLLPKYINEHKPLNWEIPAHRWVILFGLAYLVIFASAVRRVGIRGIRVTWLIPLVWFYLTLGRARHCTLFSITAAVALPELLAQSALAAWFGREETCEPVPPLAAEVSPDAITNVPLPPLETAITAAAPPQHLFTAPDKDNSPRPARVYATYLLPLAVVVCAFGLQAVGSPLPFIGKDVVNRIKLWPTALVPQLKQYQDEHPETAIFNDMAYGGLLIYYTPDLRIFIDDRCELYGDAFLQDYFDANQEYLDWAKGKLIGPPQDHFERWERQYDIKSKFGLALVIQKSGFDYYLQNATDHWLKVADSSQEGLEDPAVLYRRRDAK
jgi:hypothetical protein